MPGKNKSFEERLDALETLVKQMEAGGMELAETLKSYESGVKLAKELTRELDTAEKKMLELKGDAIVPMEDAP